VIKLDLDLKTFRHNNVRFCQEPLLSLSHVPCLATKNNRPRAQNRISSPSNSAKHLLHPPQSPNGSSRVPARWARHPERNLLPKANAAIEKAGDKESPHRSRLPAETLEAPSKPQRASRRARPAGNQPAAVLTLFRETFISAAACSADRPRLSCFLPRPEFTSTGMSLPGGFESPFSPWFPSLAQIWADGQLTGLFFA
jgi:hypothetical protein